MKLKSAQIPNLTFHVCERPELFREALTAAVNWRNPPPWTCRLTQVSRNDFDRR
jgi:hypothetical protein